MPLALAAVVVVLAAALRLEGLGRDGLWFDETVSLEYARRPLSDPAHWNNGMTLFHAVLHGWTRIAGESDAAVRVPSAVFGIVAVGLFIALVRHINGWPTALAAGLMLALAWRHVYYSQEARSYSLFIMLAVLATLLLVRLLGTPGAGRLVAYGIALAALAYSHYQWIFVLAFHNLTVLASRRRVGWGWLIAQIAVVAVYLPQIVFGLVPHRGWAPFYVERHPGVGQALWCVQDTFALPLQHAIAGPVPGGRDLNMLAAYLLPLAVASGIAACLTPLVVRRAPRLARRVPDLARFAPPRVNADLTWLPVLWLGVVFVLPFAIAQTGAPIFRWRYMAANVPVYCWFVGIVITALRARWLRVPAMALCVVLSLPALETMKRTPMREDWRGCAAEIERYQRPGDRVVLSHAHLRKVFERYYRGELPVSAIKFRLSRDEQITRALAWADPPTRVWLVVSHDPSRAVVDYFRHRPDYRLLRHYDTDFVGIELLLFEHVEPGTTPAGPATTPAD